LIKLLQTDTYALCYIMTCHRTAKTFSSWWNALIFTEWLIKQKARLSHITPSVVQAESNTVKLCPTLGYR